MVYSAIFLCLQWSLKFTCQVGFLLWRLFRGRESISKQCSQCLVWLVMNSLMSFYSKVPYSECMSAGSLAWRVKPSYFPPSHLRIPHPLENSCTEEQSQFLPWHWREAVVTYAKKKKRKRKKYISQNTKVTETLWTLRTLVKLKIGELVLRISRHVCHTEIIKLLANQFYN